MTTNTNNNQVPVSELLNNANQDLCCICLTSTDNISINEQELQKNKSDFYESIPDSCVHKFHKECILTWLKNSTTCPVCQNEILWVQIKIPEQDLEEYVAFKNLILQEEQENYARQKVTKEIQEKKQQEQIKKQEEEYKLREQLEKQCQEQMEKQEQQAKNKKQPVSYNSWDNNDLGQPQKQKKQQKLQQDEQDFPPLGGETDIIKKKQEEEKQLQLELQQKLDNLLVDYTQFQGISKIEGNLEIINIQEINEYCKLYLKQQDITDEEKQKQDLIDAETLELLQLEQMDNNIFDHKFLEGEVKQLKKKFEKLHELVYYNQEVVKQQKNNMDFLIFCLGQIKKILNNLTVICQRMVQFNCQKVMQQIDKADQQLEWGLQRKFKFLYDQYEYDYNSYNKKNQDKIIWDHQTKAIQRISKNNKSLSNDVDQQIQQIVKNNSNNNNNNNNKKKKEQIKLASRKKQQYFEQNIQYY